MLIILNIKIFKFYFAEKHDNNIIFVCKAENNSTLVKNKILILI